MKILTRNTVAFWWLALAILLLPVAQSKITLFGLPLYLPEIAVLGTFVCWWFDRSQKHVLTTLDRTVVWGAILLIFGATLSLFANPWTLTGLGMLKSWFFFPLLFSLLLFSECQEPKRQHIIVTTLVLVLSCVALRSLIFYGSGIVTYDGRLAGDFTSPNFLAFFMASGLPLTALMLTLSKRREKYYQSGAFLAATLFATTLFLTRSYGAILAACFGLLCLSFWYLRRFRLRGIFFGLGVVFILVLLFTLETGSEKWQAFSTGDPRSSWSSREMIWNAALRIAEDHPVVGIGVGRFQELYLAYQPLFPPYLEWAVPEPHNLALALFLATGLIGLFGFGLLVGRIIWLLGKKLAQTHSSMVALTLTYWIVFLTMGLVDTPLFKGDLVYLFFFMLAFSMLAIQKELPKELS